MQSFSSLNSQGLVFFTDERTPGIKTDVPRAFDIDFTETTKTFAVYQEINISEVIRPEIADVRYKINVSDVSAITVSWDTIPAGCTVTQIGSIWTIDGIDSADIWEQVKDPTITVNEDFFGNVSYSAAIVYNNGTQDIEIEWDVGLYLPVVQMPIEFNMPAVQPVKIVQITAELVSGFYTNVTPNAEVIIEVMKAGNFDLNVLETRIMQLVPGSYEINATADIIASKIPAFDNAVTRSTGEGDPEVVAADAGRLVYGHDMAGSGTVSDIGEILWANNIAENGGIGLETVTSLGGVSEFTQISAIDISGENLIVGNGNIVGLFWGNNIGTDYVNSDAGLNVSIPGFTGVRDVAATNDYFIVGDYLYNSGQGRIYVYSKDNNGNPPYSVTEEFTITGVGTIGLGYNVVANDTYIVATASGFTNSNIYVYSTADGSLLRTITGATDRPNTIDLWDKYVIVSSGFQNGSDGAYIYDVSTGNLHHTISSTSNIPSVSISSLFYATADVDNQEIKIYTRDNNTLWKTITDRNIDTSRNSIAIDDEYLITVDSTISPVSWYVVMYY